MIKNIKMIDSKTVYDEISDILNQNVVKGKAIVDLIKAKHKLKPFAEQLVESFQMLYKEMTKDMNPQKIPNTMIFEVDEKLKENVKDFKSIEINWVTQKELENINSKSINALYELGLWEVSDD